MWHIYVYTYTYIYIYIRLGVPRSFQAPSVLSRYYKRCYGIEMGGGGGVITSSGVRWIESCGNLEDVASLKMLLRCRRPMVLSLQATASKSLCGREDEKGVMFISSMVLQWIMTFSSYQQNDQKGMKPQFQWLECCTHVWPSMEDVNVLSLFCADKRQVYPRRHWNFGWSNTFREKHKTL